MNTTRRWLLLCLLLGWSATLWAGIQPSFRLDSSAWEATDIVLVTEIGQPAGKAQVVEVWKGGLREGDASEVLGLKAFASEASRTVNTRFFLGEGEAALPVCVTGQRLVLFLVRGTGADGDWQPATFWRELRVATVWLEGDKAYSFVQMMNPGPTELRELSSSSTALKAETARIVKVQADLAHAARIEDRAERARTLSAYVDPGCWEAQRAAFQELAECGLPALPTLRDMLQDKKLRSHGGDIVEAMSKAGGWAVGEELVRDLGAETKFWKETAPSLQQGWWNGKGFDDWSQTENLRNHYILASTMVRTLKAMHYRGDLDAVRALRDYWVSLPQLRDIDQMVQECDALLSPSAEAAR